MKKYLLFFLAFISISATANSQLTKGNWIMGGSGKFLIEKDKSDIRTSKTTELTLTPDVGYFILNRFVTGLNMSIDYNVQKYSGVTNKFYTIGFGPFVRYYLFPDDNRINLLTQAAYQYAFYGSRGQGTTSASSNDYLFTAGPVVYLNTSVGLELTANYELFKPVDSYTDKKFYIAIGFQIHLEREKN